ncbi:MAG: hypothetical protein LBT09_07895 [Planctomycetaceae bacterium]|jgi:hypothetical protein|nr:hypothetical protein [Planctomycetaceae bacterium]
MRDKLYTKIEQTLKNMPLQWNGKAAILEMKENDYSHWRQMEWIGFYFQYLCEKSLKEFFQFQTPQYGNVSFDGFYKIPFDFKAHAINTSSHQVIVNDSQAISQGIEEYGAVGLILALGEVVYNDADRTFQSWHE